MNHLLNITKKELRELLTPGSIMSIVVVMIMMVGLGTVISGQVEDATRLAPIGVVDYDEGEYGDYSIQYIKDCYLDNGVTVEEIDDYVVILDCDETRESIMQALKDNNLDSAIAIEKDYSENISDGKCGQISKYYLYSDSGLFSATTSAINDAILSYINTNISLKLIEDNIADPDKFTPEFLKDPVDYNKDITEIDGTIYDDVTPYAISSSMMSQNMMVPLIIMIIIVMIGSIVISSMGNEKENKTLETLLTLPVKRTTIVSGKLIASAIIGLIYGMAYMIGMNFYTRGVTSGIGGVNLADYGLSLDLLDWILIGIMIFLAIMSALGICMILGAFVKNYKAAQTMTMPVSILAIIPMFVIMFIGWSSIPAIGQTILFIIPFTHPMMAMTNLMFGDITLVLSGILYLLIFSIAMIAITVKIYKSDILLTGIGQTKFVRTLSKFGGKKRVQ